MRLSANAASRVESVDPGKICAATTTCYAELRVAHDAEHDLIRAVPKLPTAQA